MYGFFLAALAAFTVSCLITIYLASARAFLRVVDLPNDRSLHDRPTPRTGGLAVLVGIAVGGGWLGYLLGIDQVAIWVAAGAVALAAVSFLDDRVDVPAVVRFLMHTGVAALLAAVGLVLERVAFPGVTWSIPMPLALALTILYVVWMINLYNFMDGMDGFAGGMAVIGFGTLGVLGWLQGEALFAGTCWIIAASALGFLVWNFPPARIFMGDAGSSTLGFLVAACSLWADRKGIAPLWISVLVFSPFIVDATITLIRRLFRGDAIWKAHRSHYYQRLALAGWGHRRTVIWEYVLMLACGTTAILVSRADQGAPWVWSAMLGWAAIYLILAVVADRYAPFGKEDVACHGS